MRRRTNTRIIAKTEDQMIARLDRTREEVIIDPVVTVRVTTQPYYTYDQLLSLRPRAADKAQWEELSRKHAR